MSAFERKGEVRARMLSGLAEIMRRKFGPLSPEDLAFYNSIDGKEVTLTFTHGDAFEKNDNNYWLPDDTWEPIEAAP